MSMAAGTSETMVLFRVFDKVCCTVFLRSSFAKWPRICVAPAQVLEAPSPLDERGGTMCHKDLSRNTGLDTASPTAFLHLNWIT